MPQIAIVYHSVTGTTAQLAAKVAEGVAAVSGSTVVVHSIDGSHITQGRFRNDGVLKSIDESAAVVFGAPTFMGSASAQFKAFADATSDRWEKQLWRDKLASGFTIGSNLNGDQLSTLQYFSVLAAQHGMVWLGVDVPGGYSAGGLNRLGVQLGVSAQATDRDVPATDLLTARYLGTRVAKMAQRMCGNADA